MKDQETSLQAVKALASVVTERVVLLTANRSAHVRVHYVNPAVVESGWVDTCIARRLEREDLLLQEVFSGCASASLLAVLPHALAQGRIHWLWSLQAGEPAVPARLVCISRGEGERGLVLLAAQPHPFGSWLDSRRGRMLRSILDQIEDAVAVARPCGQLAYVNQAFLRMYRLQNSDLSGLTLQDLHTAHRAEVEAVLAQLRAGVPVPPLVRRRQRADGEWFDVSISLSVLRNEAGEVTGVLGISRDVTEQQRMQQRLRESEDNYRRLVERSPVGMVVHRSGHIAYLNAAARQLLGASSAEQVMGMPIASLFDPADQARARERTQRIEQGEELPPAQYTLYRLDGAVADVEMNSLRVTLDGQTAVLSVLRDITNEKRAQQALQEWAFYDPLTHLPNRRLFQQTLEQAIANARAGGPSFALFFADCDRFKQINDAWGHDVGDQVLCELARRIRGAVQPEAVVARIAGDEFLVLVPGVQSGPAAAAVMRSIEEACNQPLRVQDVWLDAPVSVGVAFYPEDGGDVQALLRRADQRMYQKKRARWLPPEW
ncbi:MAG: diguanylate cyclase [Alicyclobacillus sp.]|nr:diguanylate cyclase [Alicyclobacillus sp.]